MKGTTLNLFTGNDFIGLDITGDKMSFTLSSSSDAASVSDQDLVVEEKR